MSRQPEALASALHVYFVTPPDTPWTRLQPLLLSAVRGGVSCVQLREKTLSTREWVAKACALRALLQPLQVPLIINDRVDVALAAGADGVHLGQSDMAVRDARQCLGPGAIVGWSVATMAHVRAAADLPLDYLGVSPVFDTPSKHDTAPAWGLAGLRRVRQHSSLPLVAIGGIGPHNAEAVRAAGADGLAVVRAISAAVDPEAAAAALRAGTRASVAAHISLNPSHHELKP